MLLVVLRVVYQGKGDKLLLGQVEQNKTCLTQVWVSQLVSWFSWEPIGKYATLCRFLFSLRLHVFWVGNSVSYPVSI